MAGVSLVLTAHLPAHLVDQALSEGRDPCRAFQDWFDDSIGQWARRRGLKLLFVRVVEITPLADRGDLAINARHGLHAHVLLAGIPVDLRPAFVDLLAEESARLDRLAALHAGRRSVPPRLAPRRRRARRDRRAAAPQADRRPRRHRALHHQGRRQNVRSRQRSSAASNQKQAPASPCPRQPINPGNLAAYRPST
jgi:hypothetical protein